MFSALLFRFTIGQIMSKPDKIRYCACAHFRFDVGTVVDCNSNSLRTLFKPSKSSRKINQCSAGAAKSQRSSR